MFGSVAGWFLNCQTTTLAGEQLAVRSCLGGVGSRVPQGRGWHCSVIGF